MENQDQIHRLYRRFLANQCTREEVKLLLDFFQGCTGQEVRQLIRQELEKPEEGPEQTPEETTRLRQIYRKVREDIHIRAVPETKVVPLYRRRFLRIAAAAFVALLLIVSWLYRDALLNLTDPVKTRQLVTTSGEREKLILADGSVVWLSPASSLEYPEKFRGGSREVILNGEAFFEITRDQAHPFIVHSNGIDTRVLGTSFHIRAYQEDDQAAVTLVTGKVNVIRPQENHSVELVPNQRAVFSKQEQKLVKEDYPDAANMIARREGHFKYNGTPLAEVIADMQRAYNLDIHIEGSLEGCVVYGEKRARDEAFSFLQDVCSVTHKTIQKQGKQITITGSACQM